MPALSTSFLKHIHPVSTLVDIVLLVVAAVLVTTKLFSLHLCCWKYGFLLIRKCSVTDDFPFTNDTGSPKLLLISISKDSKCFFWMFWMDTYVGCRNFSDYISMFTRNRKRTIHKKWLELTSVLYVSCRVITLSRTPYTFTTSYLSLYPRQYVSQSRWKNSPHSNEWMNAYLFSQFIQSKLRHLGYSVFHSENLLNWY